MSFHYLEGSSDIFELPLADSVGRNRSDADRSTPTQVLPKSGGAGSSH